MSENENENKQAGSNYEESFNPQPSGYPPFSPYVEEQRVTQSKLGIASFIIGLISIILFVIGIIIVSTFIMDQNFSNSNSLQREIQDSIEKNDFSTYVPLVLGALMMIASAGISIIGLILGIVGVCSRNKRKVFSILGIVLNVLLPVGVIGLFLTGILLGGQ
ncbi:hypothetical protein ACFPYJ_32790 [Paenibacillus solisilvae]|uniref:DUF4064 domain-containing protein n=1 Tax=Paenibacillus solisilvae TaxID=2486751 RepID=A0ABW0W947_9BACL